MKFTTGKQELTDTLFTIKRTREFEFESDYNIDLGKQVSFDKNEHKGVYLYHNVPRTSIKIGENVYTESGEYLGYRCE